MTPSCYIREPSGSIRAGLATPTGQGLDSLLDGGRPPLRAALDLSAAIAETISVAESAGLVHGDLRPAHVKLAADGLIAVEGYGIPRRATKAPEGRPEDKSADRYGLGAIVYALLAPRPLGAMPRAADVYAPKLADRVAALGVATLSVADATDLRQLVTALLAFDPSERPSPADAASRLRMIGRRATGEPLLEWSRRVVAGYVGGPPAPAPTSAPSHPGVGAHRTWMPDDEPSTDLPPHLFAEKPDRPPLSASPTIAVPLSEPAPPPAPKPPPASVAIAPAAPPAAAAPPRLPPDPSDSSPVVAPAAPPAAPPAPPVKPPLASSGAAPFSRPMPPPVVPKAPASALVASTSRASMTIVPDDDGPTSVSPPTPATRTPPPAAPPPAPKPVGAPAAAKPAPPPVDDPFADPPPQKRGPLFYLVTIVGGGFLALFVCAGVVTGGAWYFLSARTDDVLEEMNAAVNAGSEPGVIAVPPAAGTPETPPPPEAAPAAPPPPSAPTPASPAPTPTAPAPRSTPPTAATPRTSTPTPAATAPPAAAHTPEPETAPEAATTYTVRFVAPDAEATVTCGDGQARTFTRSTSLLFEGTVTCLVKIAGGKTVAQFDRATTVTCSAVDEAVRCTR